MIYGTGGITVIDKEQDHRKRVRGRADEDVSENDSIIPLKEKQYERSIK